MMQIQRVESRERVGNETYAKKKKIYCIVLSNLESLLCRNKFDRDTPQHL